MSRLCKDIDFLFSLIDKEFPRLLGGVVALKKSPPNHQTALINVLQI